MAVKEQIVYTKGCNDFVIVLIVPHSLSVWTFYFLGLDNLGLGHACGKQKEKASLDLFWPVHSKSETLSRFVQLGFLFPTNQWDMACMRNFLLKAEVGVRHPSFTWCALLEVFHTFGSSCGGDMGQRPLSFNQKRPGY